MPNLLNLKGMSDLGLMADTESSALDTGPSLDDLLLNQDAVVAQSRKVRDLDELIAQLAEREGPGFLEQLKKPSTIIPLLLGIGGAAAGGGGGALAGGAFGAASNAVQTQAQDVEAQATAMEEAKKDRKEAVQELENTRQRIATLFNTNPEALVGPDGEPLNSRVIGWYATGVPLGLSTSARRAAEERGERWKRKADFLVDAIKKSQSDADSRTLTVEMLQHLGDPNPNPAEVDALVNSYKTGTFDTQFAAQLLQRGPNVSALVYAAENGLPLSHPDVLRMVTLYPPDTAGDKETLSDRTLSLMDIVSRWTLDPTNTELVSQIRSKTPDPRDQAIALVQAALASNPVEAEFLAKQFRKSDLLREMLGAYGDQLTGEQAIDRLKAFGGGNLEALLNETPDQARRRRATNAQRDVEAGHAAALKNTTNAVVALRNRTAQTMAQSLPTLGQAAIYDLVDQVYRAALEDTPISANGKRDMRTFEALMQTYTQQAIDQNKPK